jgi:hypothetical protein
MFTISPEIDILIAQAVTFTLIVIPTFMFSYDSGRFIGWTQKPVWSLLWSGAMFLALSLFAYCVAGFRLQTFGNDFIFTAMGYGALAWAVGNIVGYIDELNGAKLRWLLSVGRNLVAVN